MITQQYTDLSLGMRYNRLWDGIDKPDIRNIVHWDMSNTVEEYSQQIGRAGRDGQTSHCMFYLATDAFYLHELFAHADLPSRQSLRGLIKDIFNKGAGLSVNGIFKISQTAQSQKFDISQSPLGIIYATLELHFGLIRAITPEYTKYQFQATDRYYPILKSDKSPEGQAIFSTAVKVKYHYLDVSAAAKNADVNRSDIVKKLNQLNEHGHIELKPSGIEHRYQIIKELPHTDKEIDAVTDTLYADLQAREETALSRTRSWTSSPDGNASPALWLSISAWVSLMRQPVVVTVRSVTQEFLSGNHRGQHATQRRKLLRR